MSSPARSLRIALPSLLLLLGPALGPCTAHGRQPEPPMPGTIQEREAYRLLGSDKPIKARELAEQILVRHPDSYAGHHVLGRVLHEQEANLPRALFFLRRAVKLFEEQCAQRGQRCGEEAWRWRARTLLSLAFLCSDMDRREEELQWLDLYDESYKPKRWALRAWALMKLDRFAEARQTAWEGIAAPDPDEQDSSWTALCAIASEEQRFAEAYILCRKAALRHEGNPGNGTVEYRNAGHAAYSLLRFDEAERMLQEATRRPVASYSIPWADLAGLFTVEGRLTEAAQALTEARSYVLARPPTYVYNDQARIDLVAAELLLIAALPEPALRMVRRARLHPDRLGGTSAHHEQEDAGTAVLLRAVELTRARTLHEQAMIQPPLPAARLLLQAADHHFEAWRAERSAAALLTEKELLVSTLRPLHSRSANVASWLAGDVVAIVGAGTVLRALELAHRQEEREGAAPYLAALEGEARLAQGDTAQARRLLESALATLPTAEILLRARLAALLARAAWLLGDLPASLSLLEQAMYSDPGVLRRLAIPLPVRLGSDGSEQARRALQLLRRSPRLRSGEPGFALQVAASQVCLVSPSGTLLGCARPAAAPAGAPPVDPARALALAFHEQLFAPSLDLTQLDIRSLEGSSLSGGKSSNELKSVIDRLSR